MTLWQQRTDYSLLILGLVAGFSSALLGIGGGLIIIPVLVMFFHYTMNVATGTSLAAVLPITVVGGLSHFILSGGFIREDLVFLTLIGAFAGVYIGVQLEHKLRNATVVKIFSLFMVLMGLQMANPFTLGGTLAVPTHGLLLLLAGVLVGLASGFFGISGGTVLVPILTLLFGIPIQQAIATSLVILVPLVALGSLFHEHEGDMNSHALKLIIPTAILGAIFGALASFTTPPLMLQLLFGLILVGTGAKLSLTKNVATK